MKHKKHSKHESKLHENIVPELLVQCLSPTKQELADWAATSLNVACLPHNDDRVINSRRDFCVLVFDTNDVYLNVHLGKQHMKIRVDFAEGKSAYRRLHGGGRGQAIAKAIGINKNFYPYVLDATAGMGEDAFVLASLGCKVLMLERSTLSYILLKDGIDRALLYAEENTDNELLEAVQRLHLNNVNSVECIHNLSDNVDVIYLDPMFPERKKSAAVKKEMQVFHHYIGADDDAHLLLEPALEKANYRVVVKRPTTAPFLNQQEPTYQLKGKSTRFDIYAIKAVPHG